MTTTPPAAANLSANYRIHGDASVAAPTVTYDKYLSLTSAIPCQVILEMVFLL